MSQPKNRRRRARRLARAQRANDRPVFVHVMVSGAFRNPIGRIAPLDKILDVGFGDAVVRRDGEVYEDCDRPRHRMRDRGGFVTLRTVERHIRRMRAGHHRWTAEIDAPLWSAKWERQRPGKWVCVEAGEGFA